ncbi:hypothetical protein HBB16_13910 [Pseudonocardia sp. MCCB 268]|nr:hypothetical protein [Pseudonocardia cytotoxica]
MSLVIPGRRQRRRTVRRPDRLGRGAPAVDPPVIRPQNARRDRGGAVLAASGPDLDDADVAPRLAVWATPDGRHFHPTTEVPPATAPRLAARPSSADLVSPSSRTSPRFARLSHHRRHRRSGNLHARRVVFGVIT